jgi:hypothetical protein
VFVLKAGERLGPFSIENLLDGLESGDFSCDDVCLRPGATECERLSDLLDWEEDPEVEEEDADESDTEDDEPLPDSTPRSSETRSRQTGSRQTGSPPRASNARESDPLLYAGHPSVLTYPFALFALVGGLTGGVWLYPVDPNYTLVGLGLALAGLVRLSLIRFAHDFQIRPRRIEVITGLVARSSREVRIEDIRSINVTCRGLGGIIGIGTVDFLTSGDTPEVSFDRVWAAKKIKDLVRRLQDCG